MTVEVGGEVVTAVAEADVDRTAADGKASSVQFVHFPMTDDQATKFKQPGTRVLVGIGHAQYQHMAALSEVIRAELAGDLA